MLDAAARALGERVRVDGTTLLRERAEILHIAPQGTVSAGGTCRLLPTRDGWIAMNLARATDVDLLAAWMGHEWMSTNGDGVPWDAVEAALTSMDTEPAVERAQLLGIPVAAANTAPRVTAPVPVDRGGPARWMGESPLVVDLSALWAGPLCARLLGGLGARVVKCELAGRPDGARGGPPEFWDRLNGAKEHATLDLSAIDRLLDGAAVVVTSARARAIEQLGLDLAGRVRDRGLVWVAITGYGYTGPWRDRVAFGDDAAVAGGLAVAAGGPDAPVFVGDAPADPLAGLTGAVGAAAALEMRSGAFIDVSMRDAVARALSRQTQTGDADEERYAASTARCDHDLHEPLDQEVR